MSLADWLPPPGSPPFFGAGRTHGAVWLERHAGVDVRPWVAGRAELIADLRQQLTTGVVSRQSLRRLLDHYEERDNAIAEELLR